MILSVIIPVRNGAGFIHEAVESVLAQTWVAFELIVVDNASTDDTVSIVERFQDPRIRILREPRPGVAIAFNAGLEVAGGRYVARMDADDIACRDRFKRQIDCLDNRPNIGILGGQAIYIDEHGMVTGRSSVPLTPNAIRHASRYAYPLVNPTVIGRKTVWDQLGGWREFAPAADYDLLLRAVDVGIRVANLPDVLIKYRVRSDSVSRVNRPRTMKVTLAVRKMQHMRKESRFIDEQNILHQIQNETLGGSRWFRLVDSWTRRVSAYRPLRAVGIRPAMLSILHPVIFRTLWARYRARRIKLFYDSRSWL